VITIRVAVKSSGPGLPAVAKQMAFATALAMNRTIEEAQAAQRQGQYQSFLFRGTDDFFSHMVKIRPEDRARKDRLKARLRIEGPEGAQQKGALLARHEAGGVMTTGAGGASVDINYRLKSMFFIPTQALRPSFANPVPRSMFPANLRLTDRKDVSGGTLPANVHRTRGGKLQLKGKQRTFVLFSNSGQPWGVFQRIGVSSTRYAFNKKGFLVHRDGGHDPNIKQIWRFTPSITLRPRLRFEQRVVGVIRQRYPMNLEAFTSFAIRTAK
jgi:hypothetical protein